MSLYDRANYGTSLNIWLPKAQAGDPEARLIQVKSTKKDLEFSRTIRRRQIGIARHRHKATVERKLIWETFTEKGLGVEKNLSTAMEWYESIRFGEKGLTYTPTDRYFFG